jgi:hypothetical protein
VEKSNDIDVVRKAHGNPVARRHPESLKRGGNTVRTFIECSIAKLPALSNDGHFVRALGESVIENLRYSLHTHPPPTSRLSSI